MVFFFSFIYTYKNEIPSVCLFVCLSVCASLLLRQRFDRRYTYLVLARSLKSWERFRPGFVAFGHFWPELRAIIGTKVENGKKIGEILRVVFTGIKFK